MDFEYTPEQQAFRMEFRQWLEANLTPDLKVYDAMDERVAPDRETFDRRRAWQRTMHAAGWVGISWPKEYGGRGATLMEQVIYDEECVRAKAPVLPNFLAIGMLGPTLMDLGTEEQKRRYVPRILNADEIWCQGFSEPGAGSDLAGLRTRAVDKGDHFLVSGQKVWTSNAQYADGMYMLARTDPDAPKHKGLSYLIVDMKSPGVTVRPLMLMTGHAHFNEVFFDEVRVSKENLVGKQNEGWKVAIATLMYERKVPVAAGFGDQVQRLTALAREVPIDGRPAWDDPRVRQKLAQLAVEFEAFRLTRLRSLTRQLRGEPPGPEGSILKLYGSELGLRIAEVAGEILGVRASVNQPIPGVPDAPRWLNRIVAARQYTIGGGTSEIMRNILAERVLGLPKD